MPVRSMRRSRSKAAARKPRTSRGRTNLGTPAGSTETYGGVTFVGGRYQDGAGNWTGDASRFHAGHKTRHGYQPPYYDSPWGPVYVFPTQHPEAYDNALLFPVDFGNAGPYASHTSGTAAPPPQAGLFPGGDNLGYADPTLERLAWRSITRPRRPSRRLMVTGLHGPRGHGASGQSGHARHPRPPRASRSSTPHRLRPR